eukprot:PhM_4_TR15480/c0_g1_i1/m.56143/K16599/TTLL1; tubulin polyglutamylase TTLL1
MLANKAVFSTVTMRHYMGDFIPESYSLLCNVVDVKEFVETERWRTSQGVWVLKRADLASGYGIDVIPDVAEWWHRGGGKEIFFGIRDKKHMFVFQKYIERPYLLRGGRKFDHRAFFLVASVDPLIVCVAEGFMRLNAEPYEAGDWANPYKHLSNIARNRTHVDWPDIGASLLMSPDQLDDPLLRSNLWKQTTRIAGEIARVVFANNNTTMGDDNCLSAFHCFALDTVIDNGKMWVTECQMNPALCAGDVSVRLVNESLEIVYSVLCRRCAGGGFKGFTLPPSCTAFHLVCNNAVR